MNKTKYRIYRWDIEDDGFNEFVGDGFDSIDDAVEAVGEYVEGLNRNDDGRNTVIVQRNLDRYDRRWLCRVHLQLYGFAPEREAEKAMKLETTWIEEGEELCITSYVEIFSANW
jgi:hypothetical protein